jgi:hypothetical protein
LARREGAGKASFGSLDAVGLGLLPGDTERGSGSDSTGPVLDAPLLAVGVAGAGGAWRRAVEVLMGFFVAVDARSFTSGRCVLRE